MPGTVVRVRNDLVEQSFGNCSKVSKVSEHKMDRAGDVSGDNGASCLTRRKHLRCALGRPLLRFRSYRRFSQRARTMTRRLSLVLASFGLFFWACLASASVVQPYDESRILYLHGEPTEMGSQQGRALAPLIQGLIRDWLAPRLALMPPELKQAAWIMERHVSADFIAEMHGVADGAGVSYDDILAGNVSPDLSELGNQPLGCSTYAVLPDRARLGGMLQGRNLDYANSDLLRSLWTPTVFARSGRHAILSLNIPGLSGVTTAINDQGVMMSRMTSAGRAMTAEGVPTMLLFREVLERAGSVDEAVRLYLAEPRTVGSNVMITDATQAVVLEVAADKFALRDPGTGRTLYAANHFEAPDMQAAGHGRDERWPVLASRDEDGEPLDLDDVLALLNQAAGGGHDNILAVVADYSRHKLIFGSDPERQGHAASGPLFEIDWQRALAPR